MDTLGFTHTTSYSNILTALTSVLSSYIQNALPEGYIKSVIVENSNVTISKNQRPLDASYKVNHPSMELSPSYILEESSSGTLETNPLHKPMSFRIFRNLNHMTNLLKDSANGRLISFENHRYKTVIHVKIVVESPLQMMNVTTILKQGLNFEYLYFINNQNIAIEIPRDLLDLFAKDLNLSLSNLVDVNTLIDYLNLHSRKTIDFRINPSNGNKTITFFDNVNILTKFSNLSSTPNSVGNSRDTCEISFDVEMDVPHPTYFATILGRIPPDPIVQDNGFTTDEDGALVYKYTISSHDVYTVDGKTLVFFQKFISEYNVAIDILPLSDVLHLSIKDYIDFNISNLTLLNNTLLVKLFDNAERSLEKGIDFDFNWVSKKLTIFSPLSNHTYSVAFYCDPNILKPFDDKRHNLSTESVFDKLPT